MNSEHIITNQSLALSMVTHDKDEISHADEVITLPSHRESVREAHHE